MMTRRCSRPIVAVGVIGAVLGFVWLTNAREWGTWPTLVELAFSMLMLATAVSELSGGLRNYTGHILIFAALVSGAKGAAFIVMYSRTIAVFGRMQEAVPPNVFIIPIVTSVVFMLCAGGFAVSTLSNRRRQSADA